MTGVGGVRDQFQVDLRGIVAILSKHLYSSERVFIRELLQNAVDAITARAARGDQWQARIDVHAPAAVGEPLRVVDNGIGLGADDMREMLATIGASSKRDEFEQARQTFLGQFGIGLLSCFLVTDEIVVRSRPVGSDGEVVTSEWIGYSDGTFTIRPATLPRAEPGTEVSLRLRPDAEHLVSERTLRRTLAEFAEFLPAPVRLFAPSGDRAGDLVAWHPPPWEMPPFHAAEYCAGAFGFSPIDAVPLQVPMLGLTGVGFVLDDWARPDKRPGDRVYLKGMLLSGANTQLLPDVAFFVRGVFEAGELSPTASRESLQDNDVLVQVRGELQRQLLDWVAAMARERPFAFERFAEVHSDGLKAMALIDDGLLSLTVNSLRFPTNQGRRTLAEVVEESGRIGYAATEDEFNAVADIAAAQGMTVVNAGYVYDTELILRVSTVLDIEVHRVEPAVLQRQLREPDPLDRAAADRLCGAAAAALADEKVQVRAAAFAPASVPALFVRGTMDRAIVTDDDEWSGLLDTLDPADSRAPDAMVFNVDNRVVLSLMARAQGSGPEDPLLANATRALWVSVQLAGGRRLELDSAARLTDALAALIWLADRTRTGDH